MAADQQIASHGVDWLNDALAKVRDLNAAIQKADHLGPRSWAAMATSARS